MVLARRVDREARATRAALDCSCHGMQGTQGRFSHGTIVKVIIPSRQVDQVGWGWRDRSESKHQRRGSQRFGLFFEPVKFTVLKDPFRVGFPTRTDRSIWPHENDVRAPVPPRFEYDTTPFRFCFQAVDRSLDSAYHCV